MYRRHGHGLNKTAFALFIKPGRLHGWNLEFDKNLKAYEKPCNQRKKTKVTADMVRTIVEAANACKKKKSRIVLKEFTRHLIKEHDIVLSKKTVSNILVANDLRKPKTRKKRPKFYQSLCQIVPNGLLSMDGSVFTVFLGDEVYKFNVESAVDVFSNLCTAFSVSNTETSGEVLKVLEEHRKKWGSPLGMLSDHGSANLSDDVSAWLKKYDVEPVPAGPGNPEGNGTIEGAFGWLKRTIGEIRIDMSSKKTIAKSVLETIIGAYIKMQSRLPSGAQLSRISSMGTPINQKTRESEKERLRDYLKSKEKSNDSPKLKILCDMVRHLKMKPDLKVVKRAEKSIINYDIEAIYESEARFVKAVSKKAKRLNLAYFFGILKRIQQERDDHVYKEYCRKKYHHARMLENERLEQERLENEKPPDIKLVIDMLIKSITIKHRSVSDFAMRRVVEWINELKKTVKYIGPLRKKFMDTIAELKDVSLDQKLEIQRQIEILLPV